ncbi:hypothetical protein ASPWEDRAFT_39094 [Aspergillus wentii DTO 134E9]|uniref:DUF4604 domain-containing protein n=1 Tax=Aspergillus wentii DTO 134E9 TaxID=1073089 RepID=A0A1L9RRE8_ASPWE|nr:uncharacterized protein ASPWEDRAFT_39094 [Aspergillus wentii DTO 134E9]KAI9928112.1 hypothetical protein MW887_002145 [Aspergillus wentii]OJJ37408.1 hypothetical protein ASPWEDRAFT_39094 [Aspergillus wentii DTO 134E9]
MSYNAKNLAYEAKQPSFLQKLRSQYGDTSGRLERPIARPRKEKQDDGDDDEPTYVDEESNEVISKEDYAALVRDSNKEDENPTQDSAEQTSKPDEKEKEAPSKQSLAEIGGPKKRKQAKVVGEENNAPEKEEERKEGPNRKPKQKKKKIKLSFDDA